MSGRKTGTSGTRTKSDYKRELLEGGVQPPANASVAELKKLWEAMKLKKTPAKRGRKGSRSDTNDDDDDSDGDDARNDNNKGSVVRFGVVQCVAVCGTVVADALQARQCKKAHQGRSRWRRVATSCDSA